MDAPRTLVFVFLRGGLDGLSAVVPDFEDEYARRRPALALRRARPGGTGGALPLDDRFSLHPRLAALMPAFREGRLAVVHAAGSDDDTRSHFEAQDQVEQGASRARPLSGGFLGRWLRSAGEDGPLAALALGTAVPASLRGAPSACAVASLDEIAVRPRTGDAAGFAAALSALHPEPAAGERDARPEALVRGAARDALRLLSRIEDLRGGGTGAGWPRTELGQGLEQVARLVRKEVGLRVAVLDHGGFDTHYGQELALGGRLDELAGALAAFDRDLGPLRDRVTTVCLSEFGRRVHENASLGTDHGRGSCAFLLGGGVRGGRVHGRWPGLEEGALEDPGDLRVTTDYRDLLLEVLESRFGRADRDVVFPGLDHAPPGVVA